MSVQARRDGMTVPRFGLALCTGTNHNAFSVGPSANESVEV